MATSEEQQWMLDTVSTPELFAALSKRFDGCLLVTVKTKDDEVDVHDVRWRGGIALALGLAKYALIHLSAMIFRAPLIDEDEDS